MFDVVTADQLIKIIGHDIWTSKTVNKEREAKHKSRSDAARGQIEDCGWRVFSARALHHWQHQEVGEFCAAALCGRGGVESGIEDCLSRHSGKTVQQHPDRSICDQWSESGRRRDSEIQRSVCSINTLRQDHGCGRVTAPGKATATDAKTE